MLTTTLQKKRIGKPKGTRCGRRFGSWWRGWEPEPRMIGHADYADWMDYADGFFCHSRECGNPDPVATITL